MNERQEGIFARTVVRLIKRSTLRTFEFKEHFIVKERGEDREVTIDEKIEIGVAEAITILKDAKYKLTFLYGGASEQEGIKSKAPPCNFLRGTLIKPLSLQ